MDIKEEKISVVIPFFRNREWLIEAVDSVYNQILSPCEVIVINDGSVEKIDDLVNIYNGKEDIRLKIISQENNKGPGAARNYGIKIAEGRIIAFLDSDDIWERHKLKLQIEGMRESGRNWSVCAYNTFGERNETKLKVPGYNGILTLDMILNSTNIATSAVVVRKDIVEDGFAEGMRTGEDTYLWCKLASIEAPIVIEKPLLSVRIRKDSSYKNWGGVAHNAVKPLGENVCN